MFEKVLLGTGSIQISKGFLQYCNISGIKTFKFYNHKIILFILINICVVSGHFRLRNNNVFLKKLYINEVYLKKTSLYSVQNI